MTNLKTSSLFDLSKTIAAPLLEGIEYPWHALGQIKEFIISAGRNLPSEQYENPAEDIWIARSAEVAPSAFISGPCIIGENSVVRHCAFIRGSAIIGNNCVVGNSTEVKNSILFDCAQVPHFNYIGDSILGYKAHLGAGAVTSNVKSDRSHVVIKCGENKEHTGRIKVGAMVGDFSEIGCNSVLCPGAVIGRNSTVYPSCRVRGTVPQNCIFKGDNNISEKV